MLFAQREWKNSANAFLLAVTNIFAIQISSSLVLWIAGFRRGSTEEVQSNVKEFLKRNAVSLMFLAFLGIYLSFNFYSMLHARLYESGNENIISTALNHDNNIIDTIQYDRKEGFTLVRVSIRGDIPPSPVQIAALNQKLLPDLNDNPSIVQVRFIPIDIIQAEDSPSVKLEQDEAQKLSVQ